MSSNIKLVKYNSFATSKEVQELRENIQKIEKKYDKIIEILSKQGKVPDVAVNNRTNLPFRQDSVVANPGIDNHGLELDSGVDDNQKTRPYRVVDASLGKITSIKSAHVCMYSRRSMIRTLDISN